MHCMNTSTNPVLKEIFPETLETSDMKRPPSAGTQFKKSMDELMTNLFSKTPHYIRCIKPNDKKLPGVFDYQMVLSQVKYLGLMENVHVKRAGYCFRDKFDSFLNWYKMLSPTTWPKYQGDAKNGCLEILKARALIDPSFQMGKTKVFIKTPLMLFKLEEARNQMKHELVSGIKANYLARHYSIRFNDLSEKATYIETIVRSYLQEKFYQKEMKCQAKIAAQIKGYLARKRWKMIRLSLPKHSIPIVQRVYKTYLRRTFLLHVTWSVKTAGKQWMRVKWPQPPLLLKETSKLLFDIYRRIMIARYKKSLSAERKAILEEKLVASELFNGKKFSYPKSVSVPFRGDYLQLGSSPKWHKETQGETIKVAVPILKINRADFKIVVRTLAITTQALYIIENPDKIKYRIHLTHLTELCCTAGEDGIMVIKTEGHKKGDIFIFVNNYFIEVATRLIIAFRNAGYRKPLPLTFSKTLTASNGKFVENISVEKGSGDEVTFLRNDKTNITMFLTAEGQTYSSVAPLERGGTPASLRLDKKQLSSNGLDKKGSSAKLDGRSGSSLSLKDKK